MITKEPSGSLDRIMKSSGIQTDQVLKTPQIRVATAAKEIVELLKSYNGREIRGRVLKGAGSGQTALLRLAGRILPARVDHTSLTTGDDLYFLVTRRDAKTFRLQPLTLKQSITAEDLSGNMKMSSGKDGGVIETLLSFIIKTKKTKNDNENINYKHGDQVNEFLEKLLPDDESSKEGKSIRDELLKYLIHVRWDRNSDQWEVKKNGDQRIRDRRASDSKNPSMLFLFHFRFPVLEDVYASIHYRDRFESALEIILSSTGFREASIIQDFLDENRASIMESYPQIKKIEVHSVRQLEALRSSQENRGNGTGKEWYV